MVGVTGDLVVVMVSTLSLGVGLKVDGTEEEGTVGDGVPDEIFDRLETQSGKGRSRGGVESRVSVGFHVSPYIPRVVLA